MNFGARQAFIATPADVIGPLDRVDATVRHGESVRLDVVVRTRKVGHFFRARTVDAFDVCRTRGPRRPGPDAVPQRRRGRRRARARRARAHSYRSLLLDEHGNQSTSGTRGRARAVALVRDPPGRPTRCATASRCLRTSAEDHAPRQVNYPQVRVVEHTVRVRRRSRSERCGGLDWAGRDDGRFRLHRGHVECLGGMKHIPDIPITVMARAEATLRVVPRNTPPAHAAYLDKSVRERWNDYGIGLLLRAISRPPRPPSSK